MGGTLGEEAEERREDKVVLGKDFDWLLGELSSTPYIKDLCSETSSRDIVTLFVIIHSHIFG